MFKKVIMIAGLLGGSALFSGQAMAAADWGPCTPDTTHNFNISLDQTITDTSKNVSGMTFPDFASWNLGGGYNMICECADTGTAPTYFSTVESLSLGGIHNSHQYYIINNYIHIAADIWIAGGFADYTPVPLENVSNKSDNRSQCDSAGIYGTGNRGKLSLFINHPFVGELVIPQTKILDLFATRKPNVYGSTPAASVYLSGQIIVPQGCELSSGSTLEIPFGEFKASDFKDRKGQIPQGAMKYTKELQFKCTNISDGVKVYLHIEGTPNANDANAIDMGNPDIGAVIEGSNGKILIPNDTSFEQEMSVSDLVDGTHRVASTTISAYPISTTGKLPAAGEFEGIATMRIDVE
ncbi:long polar fimbrial protein LpfD [Pantoea agglomerans]